VIAFWVWQFHELVQLRKKVWLNVVSSEFQAADGCGVECDDNRHKTLEIAQSTALLKFGKKHGQHLTGGKKHFRDDWLTLAVLIKNLSTVARCFTAS